MKKTARPILYDSDLRWAQSNCGVIQSVHRTKRDAIKHVEHETGEPWRTAKRYMEVWPCRIVPR